LTKILSRTLGAILIVLFVISAISVFPVLARREYNISATAIPSEGGTIVPYPYVTASNKDAIDFKITPSPGWSIGSITVGSNSVNDIVDNPDGTYTFTLIVEARSAGKGGQDVKVYFTFDLASASINDIPLEAHFSAITASNDEDLPQYLPAWNDAGTYIQITIDPDRSLNDGQVKVTLFYSDSDIPATGEGSMRLFIGNPVDFNEDGTVNGNDVNEIMNAVQNNYKIGDVDPSHAKYDVNGDGVINNTDVAIVKEYANSGIVIDAGKYDWGQVRIPWIDITAGQDQANNMIWGYTWHLSLFRAR
jgi:hypothetical protein